MVTMKFAVFSQRTKDSHIYKLIQDEHCHNQTAYTYVSHTPGASDRLPHCPLCVTYLLFMTD